MAHFTAPGQPRQPDRFPRLRQRRPCTIQKYNAGLGQRNAALGAFEKLYAQFPLKLLDLLTQRRLGDRQPLRRAPEMQRFRECDKITQVAQFH